MNTVEDFVSRKNNSNDGLFIKIHNENQKNEIRVSDSLQRPMN